MVFWQTDLPLTGSFYSFDTVDLRDFRQARDRANPFESIKKEFFGTSRAALKMANIDAIFDFMFTGAADTNKSLLHFADICSGPGGFSEYVLWRKKWHAKGYGYTLEGDLDFKIGKFNPESPWDSFYPYVVLLAPCRAMGGNETLYLVGNYCTPFPMGITGSMLEWCSGKPICR